MNSRVWLLLAAIVTYLACDSGDAVLEGRAYVGTLPRDELIRSWSPPANRPSLLQSLFGDERSQRQEVLTIAADDSCTITEDLVHRFIGCGAATTADPGDSRTCIWRIEGPPQNQAISVLFREPEAAWRSTRLSAYRQSTKGDIALVGTCGSGDAYGLFPKEPEKGDT